MRLPTESEWNMPETEEMRNYRRSRWNPRRVTTPTAMTHHVATKLPNGYRLRDMLENVQMGAGRQ
jgi:hypothetical protein